MKIDGSSELIAKDLAEESALLAESALLERLKMTVDQRIEAHENARQLVVELQTVGEGLRAKPQDPA